MKKRGKKNGRSCRWLACMLAALQILVSTAAMPLSVMAAEAEPVAVIVESEESAAAVIEETAEAVSEEPAVVREDTAEEAVPAMAAALSEESDSEESAVINLSLGITGTGSGSDYNSTYKIANATDGEYKTYWMPKSGYLDWIWVSVDLGQSSLIDYVEIRSWGQFVYKIEASEDGVYWYTLAAREEDPVTETADNGQVAGIINFTSEDQSYGRYIKVWVDDPRENKWSVLEFDVWGTPAADTVESISISGDAEVEMASSTKLTVSAAPSGANPRVIWSSADTSVATVDEDGTVSGVGEGTTTITATSVVNSNVSASREIKVTAPQEGVPVMEVTLDQEEAVLYVTDNAPLTLTAVCTPEDAANKTVIWSSSVPEVAEVDENGTVTALAAGTAVITATSESNSAASASCTITVRNDRTESINLSLNKVPVSENGAYSGYPLSNATDGKDGTWWIPSNATSAGTLVVDLEDTALITSINLQGWAYFIYKIEVSEDGENYTTLREVTEGVDTIKEGTTDVARSVENFTDSEDVYARYVRITVDRVAPKAGSWRTFEFDVYGYYVTEAESVTLKDVSVVQGETGYAEFDVEPANADKRMTWSVADTGIAAVDEETGEITGVSVGTTTLYARANGETWSCSLTVVPKQAEELSLDKENVYLSLKGTDQAVLTASFTPENALTDLEWTSSDEKIAAVEDGKVTALSAGECVITVTDTVSGLSASCTVSVVEDPVYAAGIQFETEQVELVLGKTDTAEVQPVITPENVTETAVTYSSSDDEITSVDEDGVVTAVSQGTAVITATVASGENTTISASCEVIVTQPVEGVSFEVEELYLAVDGEAKEIPVVITPADATNQTVTYTIEDETVVSLDESGMLEPLKIGTTTLTAKTEDGGYTATLTVLVIIPSTSVELSSTELTLCAGGAAGKITATVLPETASSRKVLWSSSDETIATVSGGIVTPEKAGTAVITAEAADGCSSAQCVVTVLEEEIPVKAISLDKTQVTMIPGGDSTKLTLTISPENATAQNVTWTSSDKKVVLVQDGTLTSVGVGTATVTATVGELTAEVTVTVVAEENLITNDTFYVDTDGNPIFSQGGGIFKFGDIYYWYGVKYEQAVAYADNPVVTTASRSNSTTFSTVTCYSSTDLVNWTFEGDVVTRADSFGGAYVSWFGRLGVMYNEKNDNYVLVSQGYIYTDSTKSENLTDALVFLTSDSPTGLFTDPVYQKNGTGGLTDIQNGSTGDQTVFIDDDGTPYLIASNSGGRANIYVCEFNEDYTWVDKVTCVFKTGSSSERSSGLEGNCMFKYNGRYYIASSDLHGWNTSPAYVIMSDTEDILGSYSWLGAMENSTEGYSHVSQTGFFVTVQGSEQTTVLFCGDRWSGFAGNGMGFHVWVPLSFDGDGTPIFNDLSQFYFDAETGLWSVGPNNNYVVNPAFEADRISVTDPMGWEVSGTGNRNVENASPYSGRWCWKQTDSNDYMVSISQQITELPEGTYTLKAWVKSSGGQKVCNLYILGDDGVEINISLTDAIDEWTQVTVCENLTITGGSCEIGLISDACGDQWVMLDEVTLIRTEDEEPVIPDNPGDNTSDNTSDNTGDNASDNTGDNTGDNDSDNTSDNTSDTSGGTTESANSASDTEGASVTTGGSATGDNNNTLMWAVLLGCTATAAGFTVRTKKRNG